MRGGSAGSHHAGMRAMTFPRHQHHVLPAVVTEGDRLLRPFLHQVR